MSNHTPRNVFITGSTGYVGSRVAALLASRGHHVRALVRPGSEAKCPSACERIHGDPLRRTSYELQVAPSDTVIHLVGVPHPSPAKARQFVDIDLKSVEEAVPVAVNAGVKHFVYMSVAHPAPAMKAYIAVRERCEQLICESGMNATILRPWYVLGPGHRWPHLLQPIYWLMEQIPSTRDSALRLGLVTIDQMVRAIVCAAEEDRSGIRIVPVTDIRASNLA